jgi:glutaredoxin
MDPSPDVPRVRVYTIGRPCPLCEDALALLEAISADVAFDLEVVNVDGDLRLTVLYALKVPVVEVDGREIGHGRLDEATLRGALVRAQRPDRRAPKAGSAPPRRLPPTP